MTEFKIVEQLSYDWMVVIYLFLGGLSAGTYLFSVFANYWNREFKALAKSAALISPIALAIGMGVLLVDLGQPFRAWRLFLHFNPTSALSWGVWFLNIFFIFSAVYAYLTFKGQDDKAKRFAYLGLPFSILVGTYTAVLLSQAPARAMWHSALLPVLFLNGSLISGIALVLLVSAGRQDDALLIKIGKIVSSLVILELGMVLAEVLVLLNGGADEVLAARSLINGSNSFLFWIVEILLGSIAPVAILLRKRITAKAQAVASALILIGIYAMRYIIVVGGQFPS